jgi:outer membrane protein assembly factor BamB
MERTAYEGVPRVKRHVKASHASATPATDGRVVVAMFGSEGLYCYDLDGRLRWQKDLGALAVGLADDPTYEWGPASSPIIVGSRVIVQNDRYKDSYLAAFDLESGRELWRSSREELPAWSTPTVVRAGDRTLIVTNSPRQIRAHDVETGRVVWSMTDPGGEVKVPSPVPAGDLVIVTGGYPPGGRPIYGIVAGAGGELTASQPGRGLAWRVDRGSPYTGTPLVLDGILYACTDNGILSAYDVATGQRVYQERLAPGASGFSASPVAAEGRLYFTSEDGQIFVVRAGRHFELLATNDMGEVTMATPAISDGFFIVRTRTQVYALREGTTPVRGSLQ